MLVSVVICTWNRADLLDATLRQLQQLRIPAETSWELVVVNNNSTDHTAEVLDRHRGPLPLRTVVELQQGHSHARNRGIEEARGDLIVWTDDDVLVDPEWLAGYVQAAHDWPAAGYFGGPIEPWFEVPPPKWVSDNLDLLLGPFVINRLGSFVGPFQGEYEPFGANMGFRREHLPPGSFDPRLGYRGTEVVGGDETTLIAGLRTAGVQGVWVGTARVRHFIPAARATRQYIWKWFSGFGQASTRIGNPPCERSVGGVPTWAVRKYLTHRLQSLLYAPLSARRWLKHYSTAATAAGVIKEFRLRPTARRTPVVAPVS